MLLKRFLKDESGATAIEYALIGTLISLAIISGVGSMADGLGTIFSNASNSLTP